MRRCLFICYLQLALCLAPGPVISAQSELARLRSILALSDKGDNETALQQARVFLRAAPHSVEGLDLAGVLATRQGQLSEAHDYLLRAARIRPDSSRILSNLGYVLILKKTPTEAIRFLRGALLLDPESSEVAGNLRKAAQLFEQPGNDSHCAALIQQAKAEKSIDRIIVFSDFSRPCDWDGPQWLGSDFPAILKFRSSSKVSLQFEPIAAGAWVFWNLGAAELFSGSERLDSTHPLVIPLSGTGPLLLTASRPILIKTWKLE